MHAKSQGRVRDVLQNVSKGYATNGNGFKPHSCYGRKSQVALLVSRRLFLHFDAKIIQNICRGRYELFQRFKPEMNN